MRLQCLKFGQHDTSHQQIGISVAKDLFSYYSKTCHFRRLSRNVFAFMHKL